MNMLFRISLCFVFAIVFTFSVASSQAAEPTWLFSVPKAESLGEGNYNLGFLYADFGISQNLEVGIHGVKYSIPESSFAFGLSFFPLASPYIVLSPNAGSGKIHLGIKAAPYIFFAGFEAPLSDSLKFVAEINNGITAGFRIFPAENWTLDIFAAFISVDVYKYEYARIEIENFHAIPGILFAYSGRF